MKKDEESGYSYFGARYYNSDLSIWLSVDPLASAAPHQSPYTYCSNHPINRIDPNGMWDGDYYNTDGTWLGWDGINDGRIYIVNDFDQNFISWSNDMGYMTPAYLVPSAMELPDISVRQEMLDELIAADAANPNAENGGLYGKQWNSDSQSWTNGIRWATQGETGNPCIEGESISTNYNTANRDNLLPTGTFHSHPSGICTSTREGWKQDISNGDRSNAATHFNQKLTSGGTNFVFSMREQQVHLYNHKGNDGKITFDFFRKVR
jgi:RHS repeat-associated protein